MRFPLSKRDRNAAIVTTLGAVLLVYYWRKTRSPRDRLIAVLRTKLGSPYVWGAEGPTEFDCSGFISWGLIEIGLRQSGYRQTAAGLQSAFSTIDASLALPGDLIFYGRPATHVAIYLGSDRALSALGTRYGVVEHDARFGGARVEFARLV